MTTCPVPGCGARKPKGYLMCRECWHRVPRALRLNVGKTWRAYRRATDSPASVMGRLGAYRDARDAAIEASEAAR